MTSLAPPRDAGPGEKAGARVALLYQRHARALYGLCVMLLRDPHEAEDALQATFLSAYGALGRGNAPRDEPAWLAAIARNECRGRIRRRMASPMHDDPAVLDDLPAPGPEPGEAVPDPRVRQALAALSQSQREAVVLRDVLGLRAREVGTALGLSLPAVEALLFRARRQLRLRLRPVGMLVVPAAVGHALAQSIPGFVAPAMAGTLAGSAGGTAGIGLLAKLTATPAATKVAAGLAAAAAAGSVAVELERKPVSHPAPAAPGRAGVSATDDAGTDTRKPTAPSGSTLAVVDRPAGIGKGGTRKAPAVLEMPSSRPSTRPPGRVAASGDGENSSHAPTRLEDAPERHDDDGEHRTATVAATPTPEAADDERAEYAEPEGDDPDEGGGTVAPEVTATESGETQEDVTDRETAPSEDASGAMPSSDTGEGEPGKG